MPHQQRFIHGAFSPGTENIALIGGYGCGKTVAGCRLAILLAYANPGLPILYTCLDYPLLIDAILPVFEGELIRMGLVPEVHYRIDHRQVCTLYTARDHNGVPSKILFRPVDGARNMRKIIAASYGAAVKDESGLYDEDTHRKINERVRHGAASVLVKADVTTPEGLGPLYDSYVVEPRKRAATAGVDEGLLEDEPNRLVRGRTYDNPHLDPTYVDRLRAAYDARLVAAYIEGHFVPMGEGLCFRFEDWTHVEKGADYDPHLAIKLAWDFNVNPMSVTLNHWYKGRMWTFDEIVLETSHTDEACGAFLDGGSARGIDYSEHMGGVHIYGDASGRARSTKAHVTDYDIIKDRLGHMPGYQEHFPTSNPSQRESINELNALLRNGDGDVGYHIHPMCVETIKSFQSTRYADGRREIYKGEDAYEHLTDGLRYLAHQVAPIHESLRRGRAKRTGGARVR